jgi:hypothetical protein
LKKFKKTKSSKNPYVTATAGINFIAIPYFILKNRRAETYGHLKKLTIIFKKKIVKRTIKEDRLYN